MEIRNIYKVLAVIILTSFLAGCGEQKKRSKDAKKIETPPAQARLDKTIGDLAEVVAFSPIPVKGVGLVVGLPNTGSSECPSQTRDYLRQYIIAQLGPQNVNAERMINSLDTAVVLVEGFIPPAASKYQSFDVTVTALPNTQTTSLNGGRLYTTELKLIARIDESIETSKILALAAGDVRKIIQNYSDGVIFVDSDFSSIPDESSRYVRVQNSKMWLELVEGHWVEKPALTCARKILNDGQYLDAQNACRAKINSVKDILNTGLSSPNFVKIPSLFRDGSTDEGFQAVAEMPGMVNMLVIGNRAIIAKPFGPLEYGVDIFEDYVESVLGPIGISVNFVDDWDTYHRMEGEIHCGTNVKRTPHITNWWE